MYKEERLCTGLHCSTSYASKSVFLFIWNSLLLCKVQQKLILSLFRYLPFILNLSKPLLSLLPKQGLKHELPRKTVKPISRKSNPTIINPLPSNTENLDYFESLCESRRWNLKTTCSTLYNLRLDSNALTLGSSPLSLSAILLLLEQLLFNQLSLKTDVGCVALCGLRSSISCSLSGGSR